VHRHDLVEGLRGQHLSVRPSQLRTDQERLDTARREENERREEVEQADPLVVDSRQPAEQAGALLPDQFEPLGAATCDGRSDVDGYFSLSR
jgi:hypothetical protein